MTQLKVNMLKAAINDEMKDRLLEAKGVWYVETAFASLKKSIQVCAEDVANLKL